MYIGSHYFEHEWNKNILIIEKQNTMEKRLTVHTRCCGTPQISRTSQLSIDQNSTTDITRTISDGLAFAHKSQILSQMAGTQSYVQTFICFKIDLKVGLG